MKIAVVSGGFDPLHSGHINLLESAAAYGDKLVVLLNSDDWLTRKKGRPFMPFEERKIIVSSLRVVYDVIGCVDEDQTVCETLRFISENYDGVKRFCNGGDRTSGENTPEHKVCLELGIESVYGLGDKIQSSSWLTK